MPALRRDRRAGGEDRRQCRVVAQRQRDEATVTEIAQRRDPTAQGAPCRLAGPDAKPVVVDVADLRFQRAVAVEAQVLVTVDEPGQERAFRELHRRGIGRTVHADVDDRRAVDQHDGRLDHPFAVEDPGGSHDQHAAILPRRFTSTVSEPQGSWRTLTTPCPSSGRTTRPRCPLRDVGCSAPPRR